jgi:predicted nucleotidyltransferase
MAVTIHDEEPVFKRVQARKELLAREVRRFVEILKAEGAAEKVILFGTSVHGGVHEWSDIDLVVVERTDLPFFQRVRKVRSLLGPKVGLDLMVYTPEEFERLCAERPFFQEEILGKGKVLYERGA